MSASPPAKWSTKPPSPLQRDHGGYRKQFAALISVVVLAGASLLAFNTLYAAQPLRILPVALSSDIALEVAGEEVVRLTDANYIIQGRILLREGGTLVVEGATLDFEGETGAPVILLRDRATLILRDVAVTGTEVPALVMEGSARAIIRDATLGTLTLNGEAVLRAENSEIRSLELLEGASASLYGVTILEGASMTGESVSLTTVNTEIRNPLPAGRLVELSVGGGSLWIRESTMYATGLSRQGFDATIQTTLLVEKLAEETVSVVTVSQTAG